MEGPPSGDPTYVFPDARTVVSFAIPLGTDYIEDYLGKKTRMVFKRVLYEKYQLVGASTAAAGMENGRPGRFWIMDFPKQIRMYWPSLQGV